VLFTLCFVSQCFLNFSMTSLKSCKAAWLPVYYCALFYTTYCRACFSSYVSFQQTWCYSHPLFHIAQNSDKTPNNTANTMCCTTQGLPTCLDLENLSRLSISNSSTSYCTGPTTSLCLTECTKNIYHFPPGLFWIS